MIRASIAPALPATLSLLVAVTVAWGTPPEPPHNNEPPGVEADAQVPGTETGPSGASAAGVQRELTGILTAATGDLRAGRFDAAAEKLAGAQSVLVREEFAPREQASWLFRLASLHRELARQLAASKSFDSAASHYRAAADRFQRLLPPEDPRAALARFEAGRAARQSGDYDACQRDLGRALEAAQAAFPHERFPEGHPLLALVTNEMGVLARECGDYLTAISHYENVLALLKRQPKTTPKSLAAAHNNLAIAQQWHGDYAASRRNFEAALEIYLAEKKGEAVTAEDAASASSDAAMIRHSLGGLLQSQGEYRQALREYDGALAQLREVHGESDDPEGLSRLATACSSLGMLHEELGQGAEAVAYHREALTYRRRLFVNERPHPAVALSLHHLGDALREAGSIEASADALERALTMQQRLYGDAEAFPVGHPAWAGTLAARGLTAEAAGDLPAALDYLQRATAAYERLYDPAAYRLGHPDLAKSLSDMGRVQDKLGRPEAALQSLERAATMRYELAEQFLVTAAEAEARSFIDAHLRSPGRLIDLWDRAGVSAERQVQLLWRGRRIVQRLLAARNRYRADRALAEPASEDDKLRRYLAVRDRLARLTLASLQGDDPGPSSRTQLLRDLTEEKEAFERELSATGDVSELSASATGLLATDGDAAAEQVRRLAELLPANAAWVDIVEFDRPQVAGDVRRWFTAYVASGGSWHRVDLGPQATIEERFDHWLFAIRRQRTAPETAQELAEQIWQPIAKCLPESVNRVYLCPDGILARMPWPALRSPDGQFLVERYNFQLMPSGSYLLESLRRRETSTATASWRGEAILVGGVDYGRRDDVPAAGRPPEGLESRLAGRQRSGGKSWSPLRGAAAEVAEIEQFIRQTDGLGLDTVRLGGTAASVEAVLDRLPGAKLAHLATHGIFVGKGEGELAPAGAAGQQGLPEEVLRRNPLLCSGLALAGANGESGEGWLMAERLAARPMPGLNLVVLSACDSGNGQLVTEEGVYGLQQAFHLAGVRHVVASRWKVDDEATKQLMTRFYHYLFGDRLSVSDALRGAQLEVLRGGFPAADRTRGTVRRRPPKASPEDATVGPRTAPIVGSKSDTEANQLSPYFWAAFSASGD